MSECKDCEHYGYNVSPSPCEDCAAPGSNFVPRVHALSETWGLMNDLRRENKRLREGAELAQRHISLAYGAVESMPSQMLDGTTDTQDITESLDAAIDALEEALELKSA